MSELEERFHTWMHKEFAFVVMTICATLSGSRIIAYLDRYLSVLSVETAGTAVGVY